MNYFCDSGGVIFHVDPERVFQGSANANVINFFGAFPSNAEVLIAYELPDKTWTTPKRMTPIAQLSSVLDGKGNAYAGWQTRIGATLRMENGAPIKDENGDYIYDLDYTVTEKYGTVGVQFFVYANGGNGLGAQIASARSSFVVEKGVPIVLPDTPTDDYEVLLGQILAAISDKNEQIDTNAEDIAAMQTGLQTTDANVAKNATDISALQGDVQRLDSRVTDSETGISLLTFTVSGGVVATGQLSLDDNYVLKLQLFAKDGTLLSTTQVDFPVESMVINGAYDDENKQIVLTLQNGNTVDIPVGDLINGLISSTEKGQPNGVATLDEEGKVPAAQLPAGQGGDLSDYVKFTDYANYSNDGVAKGNFVNIGAKGFFQAGVLYLIGASDYDIANRTGYVGLTAQNINKIAKAGLTTNTETLTDEEKEAAQKWLGITGGTKLYLHKFPIVYDAYNTKQARYLSFISTSSEKQIVDYMGDGTFYTLDAKWVGWCIQFWSSDGTTLYGGKDWLKHITYGEFYLYEDPSDTAGTPCEIVFASLTDENYTVTEL